MKCWSTITPVGRSARPGRTSTLSPSTTVKSPSPVIMRADITAVPALVPPKTTPARWRARTAWSSVSSRSTSMIRPWSPPPKKTPVARASLSSSSARPASVSGASGDGSIVAGP